MMKRSVAIVAICCLSSFLSAGTVSIGSVYSQGDFRIDNHPVRVSGTIFEGSVLETGTGEVSRAEVHLADKVKVTLYDDSRGTVYHDHLVLLHGEIQVTAPNSFRTEAAGLIITSSEPQTTGLISIGRDGRVDVSAQTGSFHVAKDHGIILAQVNSQKPLAFSPGAGGQWTTGNANDGDFRKDFSGCYLIDDKDDRDCDHHHHHHASR